MNPSADDRLGDAHHRVISRVFGAGLTLAGVLSLPRLDSAIADRLRDAIDDLDTAARELQGAALNLETQDRDVRLRTAPAVDPKPNGHRRLNRITSDQVFAYAIGRYDFYRAADHVLWAHERDGLLVSARSGTPIARRDGNIFYDIDSDVPVYYEDHCTEPPPAPPNEIIP
jgi:hypothetical protein